MIFSLRDGIWLAVAFLSGFAGADLVARFGEKMGLIDAPNNRSSHKIPIPRGGGIGILAFLMIYSLGRRIPWSFCVPVIVVSVLSFVEDMREIPFRVRLTIQLGAAAIVSMAVLSRGYPELGPLASAALFLAGILYVAATANYFNFMDGINGLAGWTGVIAFSMYGIYGLTTGMGGLFPVLALGCAAACLGFLPFNSPRAKVFMGDVGSILLGFLYAALVFRSSRSLTEFLALSMFILPFYLDEAVTLVVRIKSRESLVHAHRRHIYQVLANQAKISHSFVTFLYCLGQMIVIFLALWLKASGFLVLAGLILALFGTFFVVSLFIRNRWEIGEGLKKI